MDVEAKAMTGGGPERPVGERSSAALSLVVPFYNEEDNVEPLVERIHAALADYPQRWELILVNDGSADATGARMVAARARWGRHVRVVDLQRNFGQTAALQAGIDYSRGDVIALMDGDLQNDPLDIPDMVARLIDEDLDLVTGWRKSRKDSLSRRIPSRIANRLIRDITQVELHDYGCSLKVFRAHILRGVRLYGEMHRFIPAWLATRTSAARIREHVVRHHARVAGRSKYGLSRAWRVIIDLLAVYFFMRFRARPGHFFGAIGLFFGAIGAAVLAYLIGVKLLYGEDIGDRPLLLGGIMCVVLSVQLLTTGVLSEMMSRTYFESADNKSYLVRNEGQAVAAGPQDWKLPPPA
jgi:glycosyltransferase involved in cell wall biosynthesis